MKYKRKIYSKGKKNGHVEEGRRPSEKQTAAGFWTDPSK